MTRLLLLAAALAFTSRAGAQLTIRDTTPIPRDLALALLRVNTFGDPDPAIVIGGLPHPGLASLVPPGARILGGLAYGRGRGPDQRFTAVLEVPETPDSIINVIETLGERAGWRKPPAIEEPGERGGFVDSHGDGAFMVGMMSGLQFCSDSASVQVMASGAGHVSVVQLQGHADPMGMICGDRRRAMMRSFVELPTLRPPPGTSSMGSGAGGSQNSREASAQLNSRISAQEMLRHFVGQLEEQGWTVSVRVNQPDIGVASATKRSEGGDTLRLMLLDHRYDARSHYASMRVWNSAGRP